MRKLWTSRVISTNVIVFGAAFLATMLISSALAPVNSSNAAETKLTATVTYATHSIALTPSDATVLLDIDARPSGAMSVASTTINTNTTSPNGYKLYLSMNSNTSDLVQQGSTNTISSSTGTLASPAKMLSNSVWGYAIPNVSTSTVVKPNGFDASYTTGLDIAPTENKFAGIPNSEQPAQLIAEKSSASASSGDDLDIIYAVRAGYDTPIGTYSNKVVYTAVADGGAGHNMVINPSQTSNTAGGDKIKLITTFYGTMQDVTANAYLLTNAELANVKNKTNPISDYAAKQLSCTRDTSASTLELECTTPAASIGNYNIYLDIPDYSDSYDKAFNYVEATFWNISAMQQMTPALCASVTTPAASATRTDTTGSHNNDTSYVPQRTLYDIRDDNSYTIRKLADGNCWMTQNLTISGTTIDYTDSNLPGGASYTVPASSTDGWCTTADESCINTANVLDANNSQHPEYGTYYSWKAATAGYGTYSTTSGNVSYSVCPKGWRLPTGGTNGAFQDLYNKYNSASAMLSEAGPNFVLSGYRDGGSTHVQGSYGSYWSSKARSSGDAYHLRLGSSTVSPANLDSKYHGLTVRCVAQ